MAKRRVVIVDDHPIVREGLAQVIAGFPGYDVIATGHTAADAVALVSRHAPDVLVLDLGIPGTGVAAIKDIMRLRPQTRILVLTISERAQDVLDAMRLGAMGYVLKGISGDELCEVLNVVAGGAGHITPHLAARILATIGTDPTITSKPDNVVPILSKRESEIYALIRRGQCNKEIGRSLNLSEKTVKHYLTNIFRKLDIRNRTELALHVFDAIDATMDHHGGGPHEYALRHS